MNISNEGECIVWRQCLPTKFHHQRRRSVTIAMQDEWIKVFISADIGKYIMEFVRRKY